jgi:uncharacterized protein YndB with AHSA1/START domain
MKRIETVVVIQMPIEHVFAFLIKPSNLPEWAPGFVGAKSTSEGPIRVGSTSTRITNFSGRDSESQHVVTEFEQNSRMAVSSKMGPMEIKEIFELKPADRGTRVIIAEEVTAPLLLRPAEWIFGMMAGKNIDKYGPALKHRLEESG